MNFENGDLALVGTGIMAVVAVATFYRSGGWNALTNAKASSHSHTQIAERVKSLEDRAKLFLTAADLAAHDSRLHIVESAMKDLPSGKQIAELTGSINTLEAKLGGQLSTIAAEMRGADTARTGLQLQVNRIEQYLLDQSKTV